SYLRLVHGQPIHHRTARRRCFREVCRGEEDSAARLLERKLNAFSDSGGAFASSRISRKPQPFGEGCVSIPKAATEAEAAALLRSPHCRREYADRRLHAQGRQVRDRAGSGASLCLFPPSQGAVWLDRRLCVGRRTADVRDRPCPDVASEDDPARRAFDGPRAADRRRDLRDREGSERQGRCVVSSCRAEHQYGTEIRQLWLTVRIWWRGGGE